MNFKHWLLISEEEKIAKAKPLPDVNSTRYIKNAQNLIALGNHFKDPINNRKEPYGTSQLGRFLRDKRHAFQDFENKEKPNYIKTTGYKWYDTDKLFGIKAGLPNDWHLFTGKYTPERPNFKILKQKNDQNIKNLGIHFKNNDNKEPYSSLPLGIFLYEKRQAFQDYEKMKKDPNHIKRTSSKWYDTDPQVAKDAGLPNDWHLFTGRYTPQRPDNENYRKKNDQNLKKLGIYFKKFGEPNSSSSLGEFLNDKRKAFQDFENKEKPNYTKTTNRKWYYTDPQVAKDAGLPNDWHLFTDKENISQGEKLVGKTLNKLKLNSIHQYQDKECNIITGQCLKFDYSFEYKDQEYFVEYHGGQHYYPVYFGSREGKTKKEIAEQALDAFEILKKNDLEKYNYCKEKDNNFPLLVIPYWITTDRFKDIVIEFLKTNQFNEFFANPNVPPAYKVKHNKIFYKTECFATNGFNRTVNCKKLDVKLTFEQFLINKNFINI